MPMSSKSKIQHVGVPGYGTDTHKYKLFELFHADDANIKQNKEFIEALDRIKPLIERNLIQLTDEHLPLKAAFRVPEHSYLGISMDKHSLYGQAINMPIVNDLFKTSPCEKGEELSCFLTYLYPQWYASEKEASFGYISGELEKSHYKIIPLDSFTKSGLHFLKLTLPVYELKSVPGFLPGFQGTWDSLMTTPPEIVHQLKQVSSHDKLSQLISTVIGQDVSLDGNFFRTFAGMCDQLNITFDEYETFIKDIFMFQPHDIKMHQLMIKERFTTTSWYERVVTKLGTVSIPDDKVHAFILAVALVDVITPLYMQHIVSKFVDTASRTVGEDGLSEANVKEDLKDLCRQNPSSDQIADKVNEIQSLSSLNEDTKQTLVKNLFKISNSYNVISEVERNKMNFGIMNIELTNALIDFFETWYLKDIHISESGSSKPTSSSMLDALTQGTPKSKFQVQLSNGIARGMRKMYGTSFRISDQVEDFYFALCLNILLFQLFPNKVAGYYLGQSVGLQPFLRQDNRIGTMNAELTMTQLYNQNMTFAVRSVKRKDNRFDTAATDSDGGGRRKRTRRNRQKKHIKSKFKYKYKSNSNSKPVSKRKKKLQHRTTRFD